MPKRARSIVEIRRSDIKWKSNKKGFKETKKQRKLFEFDIPTASSINVRSKSSDEILTKKPELIVIKDEDEDEDEDDDPDIGIESTQLENVEVIEQLKVEKEKKIQSNNSITLQNEKQTEQTMESESEPVEPVEVIGQVISCPLCNKDLSQWEDYQRDAHAEKCLEKLDENGTKPLKKAVKRPLLPEIKVVEFKNGHKIVVDGFNYDRDKTITQYFLSHFHADHYIGLKKSWDHGTIYGSNITINLMLQKFNIPKDLTRVLPVNSETWFEPTISVIPLDANHCPGATVFLFQEWDVARTKIIKQILHTGDFRSNDELITRLSDICLTPIDQVYLDTTYLIPGFHFPYQKNVLAVSAKFCQLLQEKGKKKLFNDYQKSIFNFNLVLNTKNCLHKYLFLIGTYTIGKEKLAISIALALNTKIYVPENTPRFKIISKYLHYFPEGLITNKLTESCVHLVPLSTLRAKESIDAYFKPFSHMFENAVGFIPTGWTYTNKYAIKTDFKTLEDRIAYCEKVMHDDNLDEMDIQFIIRQYKKHAKYQVFNVPYSEHSSFKDLIRFGTAIKCKQILATVNLHRVESIREMQEWFRTWQTMARSQPP